MTKPRYTFKQAYRGIGYYSFTDQDGIPYLILIDEFWGEAA